MARRKHYSGMAETSAVVGTLALAGGAALWFFVFSDDAKLKALRIKGIPGASLTGGTIVTVAGQKYLAVPDTNGNGHGVFVRPDGTYVTGKKTAAELQELQTLITATGVRSDA